MGAVKNSFVTQILLLPPQCRSCQKLESRGLFCNLVNRKKMIDTEKCHILLVQEELDALLMERVLERDGFKNIYKASSSNDAFLILEETTPDLIILFYRPLEENGPTGIDLFRWFKQLPKLNKTSFLLYPIVLHQEFCQELKDMGFSGVVGHPIDFIKFPEVCSIVLNGGTYFRDCDKYW